MTPDEIAERLDTNIIVSAAWWAAESLDRTGFAVVYLAPGDATRYEIIVIAPGARLDEQTRTVDYGEYIVSLGRGLGTSYPWTGNHMHVDYVAAKWVADRHPWTSVVLTQFLNALADAIELLQGDQP